MNTGQLIRKYRKEKNLSMKQLGALINVSEQAISQYERGIRSIKLETLIDISEALNVELKKLQPNCKFNDWNKKINLNELKVGLTECEVISNLIEFYGYKFSDLNEHDYKNLKNRLKNFIDFEFYNMK